MKVTPAVRMFLGIAIGIVIGCVFENIWAGVCLGASVGCLAMLLSFTTESNKNQNQ